MGERFTAKIVGRCQINNEMTTAATIEKNAKIWSTGIPNSVLSSRAQTVYRLVKQ